MMNSTIARRNNVTIRGHGPPVVFAHGFGCDQRMWQRVAPRFEATHTVVAFDYVGAGNSDRGAYDQARYRSIDGYVHDVLDVCKAVDLQDAVFVGHSVSTMVGLRAVLEAPQLFERMVLLAPSPSFINDPPYVGGFERRDVEDLLALMDANFMGWANALSQMAVTVPELAHELRESFCSTDPRYLREFACVAFTTDSRSILDKVRVPCCVVQCARDDLAPPTVGRYVADNLRNASYELLDIPGHMPHMSHPDDVARVIWEYITIPSAELRA